MSTTEKKEISNYWQLCDELSVKNAALLVVGVDPASEDGSLCEARKVDERPEGYEAAKHAIGNALRKGLIEGCHFEVSGEEYEFDLLANGGRWPQHPTDMDRSVVERDSLVHWLKSRGVDSGFFFPRVRRSIGPEYLDKSHPRYSPKLAAAVTAWTSFSDVAGRTPKQIMTAWLKAHSGEYGLCDGEGDPITQAIEEIAKVANWLPGGGAPKTPS